MSNIFSGEKTHAKAMVMNTAVSIACEMIFERVEVTKKFVLIFFAAKKTMTSIYSDTRNAKREAILTRHESEKIVSYAFPMRS